MRRMQESLHDALEVDQHADWMTTCFDSPHRSGFFVFPQVAVHQLLKSIKPTVASGFVFSEVG